MKRILPLIMLLITSCSSTLDFHVPTQNFVTPEVTGDSFDIRAQTTYTNSTRFELAKLETNGIFTTQASVSTDQGSNKDNVLNATLGLGIGNALEVTYRSYSDSPDLIGLKAQILGRDGGKKSKGIKASIFAGYGSGETDNDTITAQNGSGGSRQYNATLDVESSEIGAVIGYRINKTFLPYLAFNSRQSDADGTLDSSSYTQVRIANKAKIQSLQLGIQLDAQSSYFLLEGGYAKSKWGGLPAEDDYTLGLALGLVFR